MTFCYNSKKEHHYFFYPSWKPANMSTSFKDASSHTLQCETVCRLTYICYISADPGDTFPECSQTHQQADQPKGCMKTCTCNLQCSPDYVPLSYGLQSGCGMFFSSSFMTFKPQFRTCCDSSC